MIKSLLSDLALCNDENLRWNLPRPELRNQNFIVNGIVLSGRLTNSSIGIALHQQANLIVLVEEFNRSQLPDDDIFEILYKNNIFILSLNYTDFFNRKNGQKLVAHIFGGAQGPTSKWVSAEIQDQLTIFYELKVKLSTVLDRFPRSLLWIPQRMKINNSEIFIQKVSIALNPSSRTIFRDQPHMIISSQINQQVLNISWKKDIIYSWINIDDLLNEISRELTYIVSSYLPRMRITFATVNPKEFSRFHEINKIIK